MTSDLFFLGKLKELDNLIMYEEEFVLFYLSMKLSDRDLFKKDDVEKILVELYGKENIKNNHIEKFCKKNFIQINNNFKFQDSEYEDEFIDDIVDFAKQIELMDDYNKNDLYKEIEKEVFDRNIKFNVRLRKCLIYFLYESNSNMETKYIIIYKYQQILKKYYELYRIIDNKLEKIPDFFDILEISEMKIKDNELMILIYNNIFTIKNLKKIYADVIICIFCRDIKGFIKEISNYAIEKKELLLNMKSDLVDSYKPSTIDIIKRRVVTSNNKKETLEMIGKTYNMTRERVRQIEKKTINSLKVKSRKYKKVIYCIFKEINRENKQFIEEIEFEKHIDDVELVPILLVIMLTSNDIKYNEEYGIIFDNRENSFENIINENRESIKDFFPVSDINELNKVQKMIIDSEYRIYQEKIYVKKSINISAIYMNEIKENFASGYDIGSDEDYNKLIDIIAEKYGNIEMSSKHSIQAMIDRDDFIQVDRGKYLSREYASNLSEELVDQIIDYIINNSPIVAYNTIFEMYKNELLKNGIKNRFYLKGVLDEKLPKEFNTGRDYINTNSDNSKSLYDIMPQIFRAFDAEFTMDDIKEKMPGLNDYNYENYIRAEEDNGLIRIANRTYIYIDKLKINEEIKNELKVYIDDLFKTLDSKILTAQKIYTSLAIKNKDLLSKIHITSRFGDYELYYIIKYLYKNNYYFSRPIISIEENFNTSVYVLAQEYVKRLERFNYGDVKSYLYKMNLGIIYSYLNFMEDMSEDYVQFNKDSMIKKGNLRISEEQLSKIHELMAIAVNERGLQTNNFDGYFMLPKLEKSWNKYLLVGIIRSYFKEEFEIENTTNNYDTTDFIIRRIK